MCLEAQIRDNGKPGLINVPSTCALVLVMGGSIMHEDFRVLSGAFGNHVKSAPIRLDVFKLHACMRGISAKLSFNGCICFYLSQLINSSIDCIYSCPTENCYRWHFDNAAAGQLGRSHCNTGGNDSHNTKTYFFSMATKHFPSNFSCHSVMQNSMQII
jgi:hypothetical protein